MIHNLSINEKSRSGLSRHAGRAALLTLVFAIMTALTGCASRQERTLDRLERLVVSVEENGSTMTEAQWEESSDRFDDLLEEIYEHRASLTKEQRQQVGRLKARYTKAAVNNLAGTFSDLLNQLSDEAAGFADEFGLDLNDIDMEDIMDGMFDAMNDVNDAMEEVTNAMEDLNDAMEDVNEDMRDGLYGHDD